MPDSVRPGAPRVDEANECIWRGGERVTLVPKAFRVLRCLMQQPDRIVTKSELLDAAWPDAHVGEAVLIVAINQLRDALGDDRRHPRFIETVHRRGYRWIGDREVSSAGSQAPGVVAMPDTQPRAPGLVGRTESLDELMRRYARAAAGQRQFVLVSGEPGIGKTALVDEFVRLTTASQPTACLVARGQCIEFYGAGDLNRSVREATEHLLRDGSEDVWAALLAVVKHDQARQRLTDELGGFDEGLEEADLRDAKRLLDEVGAG